MMKTSSFDEIGALVTRHQRFVVTSHIRPDGDAIGSAVALAETLEALGKEVVVFNEDGVPDNLKFLPGSGRVRVPVAGEPYAADVVFALDTASRARLGATVTESLEASGTVVNIDHHVSNPGYGDLNYIDDSSPAAGQIVKQFIQSQGYPLTPAARDNLFVAISTDTGSFQFPNTTSETYRIGADLIDAGADVGGLSQKMYESYPLRRLHIMQELFATLRIGAGGNLASWTLPLSVTESLGVKPDDTEGLIDIIRGIDSVVVAIFFEELEDGRVRVSIRSKTPRVDVCKICQQFGGGGHSLAAGARLPGPLQDAQERVISVAKEAIENGRA